MAIRSRSLEGTPPRYIRWQRRWADLLAVHQALLGLVEAKHPLSEGLLVLSQDGANRALTHTFYRLHKDVEGGSPLSRAMANQDTIYPQFSVDMVRAGEESGKLEDALAALARKIEISIELRLRSALHVFYLGCLLFVESALIGGLTIWVVPQFVEIFGSFGSQVSPLLHILSGNSVLVFFCIATMMLPALWVALQYSAMRNGLLHRCAVRVSGAAPYFRRQHLKHYVGDGCAMVAMLAEAGIPLHKALYSAAEASPSVTTARLLTRIADRLQEGESLQAALEVEKGVAPRAMISLLSLAESSGKVPEGFQQVADLFHVQVRRSSHLTIEIGAPIAVCVIGLIVACFYMSIFLTIFRLVDLVR